MECDYAEQEKTCRECPDEIGKEHSPDGYCEVCPLRALDAQFPAEFREWVSGLIRLHNWRKAGYSISADELTSEGWDALALITRWYEVKDLEAAAPRVV